MSWGDYLAIILLIGGYGLVWKWFKPQSIQDVFLRLQFFPLLGYHLAVTIYFHYYMRISGGDAIRYWEITADGSQYAKSWMHYFGYSTFFIQWLNFIPSKLLGLSFLIGNLIYGFFSFVAITLGLVLTRSFFPKSKSSTWQSILPFIIWWFPGLHFWTAGVGKESLLFLGLILTIWSLSSTKVSYLLLILGIAILILVRPFWGILVLLPTALMAFIKTRKQLIPTIALVLFSVWSCWFGARWIWERAHLEDFSLAAIQKFSNEQLAFLATFKANSALPMQEMNFWERLLAVSFRPFLWEVWSVQSLIYAFENLVFLILILVIPFAIRLRKIQFRWEAVSVLLIILLVWLSFSMTLDNYGVFYRMKSIWLPPLYIVLLWLIWPLVSGNKSKCPN